MTDEHLQLLKSYAESAAPIDVNRLAEVISAMAADTTTQLTSPQVVAAFDILYRLYPRAEVSVRRVLAERLSAREDVPHALLILLANDTIEIAGPLIRRSSGLQDDDLIHIAADRSADHRLAVCERPTLSEAVCDVLAYLGDPDVMVALAKNPGAQLSGHAMRRLVVASRNLEALHEPLLNRKELSANLAALMYHWVSDALRRFIASTFGDALAERLKGEITAAVNQAYRDDPLRATPPATEQSSWAVVLSALRSGDLARAERALAGLTGLKPAAVERILYNDDGQGLAVLCRAFNGSRLLFSELYDRLHGAPPYSGTEPYRQRSVALAIFNDYAQDRATEVLEIWRKDPNQAWGNPEHHNSASIRRRIQKGNL